MSCLGHRDMECPLSKRVLPRCLKTGNAAVAPARAIDPRKGLDPGTDAGACVETSFYTSS